MDKRPQFWETVPMDAMTHAEWEALCDGCGKCCMNKLEDEDTGEVAFTRVACRLFDDSTCQCTKYPIRHQYVPECITMRPDNIENHLYWLPNTCAYRLLHLGAPLPDWHPLITGTTDTVHRAKVSMQNRTVSEEKVSEDDWEAHVIEEPEGR